MNSRTIRAYVLLRQKWDITFWAKGFIIIIMYSHGNLQPKWDKYSQFIKQNNEIYRDYSASEFGALDVFNPATAFIDVMAKIGWAYDLKRAS